MTCVPRPYVCPACEMGFHLWGLWRQTSNPNFETRVCRCCVHTEEKSTKPPECPSCRVNLLLYGCFCHQVARKRRRYA